MLPGNGEKPVAGRERAQGSASQWASVPRSRPGTTDNEAAEQAAGTHSLYSTMCTGICRVAVSKARRRAQQRVQLVVLDVYRVFKAVGALEAADAPDRLSCKRMHHSHLSPVPASHIEQPNHITVPMTRRRLPPARLKTSLPSSARP